MTTISGQSVHMGTGSGQVPSDTVVDDKEPALHEEPSTNDGRHVAVVGGGPAGLMAAEQLAMRGVPVVIYEARPSPGRKFLRAGIGGLNLTHSEDYSRFCGRYGDRLVFLQPALDAFPPDALRAWASGLGVETFEGTSGRVFPVDMKAAPLLRAQLNRLRAANVRVQTRHRWMGWGDFEARQDAVLRFDTPGGLREVRPLATVLALGGGSWPQLGSDAAWVPWLQERGVEVAPLLSANCGFNVEWSEHLRERYAGSHLKSVTLSFTDLQGQAVSQPGEFVITRHGVEGSLIYAHSRRLREVVVAHGHVRIYLDLLPGRSQDRVFAEVSAARGARSMSSHLQSKLKLRGVKTVLLREVLDAESYRDPSRLAQTIKALPITLTGVRPLAEAISSAGGVRFSAVDDSLMLKALPGVFVAGEMLDWEAPTGGYLLTACLAQGAWAAQGVLRWLESCRSAG